MLLKYNYYPMGCVMSYEDMCAVLCRSSAGVHAEENTYLTHMKGVCWRKLVGGGFQYWGCLGENVEVLQLDHEC